LTAALCKQLTELSAAAERSSIPLPSPNFGQLITSGTLINTTGANPLNYSGADNSGSFYNNGMLGNDDGTFRNSGILNISSAGLFTTSMNYTQTSGSTIVDGKLTATGNAMWTSVLMAGTMMPGDAPGTLTIFGNYEQTGTGVFEELMSPCAQAFLDVSGNVVLDPGATLDVTLLVGFHPPRRYDQHHGLFNPARSVCERIGGLPHDCAFGEDFRVGLLSNMLAKSPARRWIRRGSCGWPIRTPGGGSEDAH